MGLGKKNRGGKQRKAAKQQTAASATVSTPAASNKLSQLVVYTPKGETYVHPNHHELVTAYFQRGDSMATTILATLTSEDVPTHGICWPNISLVGTILWTLLYSFVGKCDDSTFDKVLTDMRAALGSVSTLSGAVVSIGGGGDLQSPSLWIKVLIRAAELEPKCKVEIAENIDALVKCMGNDTDRLFFKSNDHWKEGIESFVLLCYNLIMMTPDEDLLSKVIGLLLYDDEDFIRTFVKIGFWKDQRPDIVELLGVKDCTDYADMGNAIIRKIVTYAADNPSSENRRLLGSIGCMPIVSKAYDFEQWLSMATTSTICYPGCISYTAGLIRCFMQKEGLMLTDQKDDGVVHTVKPLMCIGDCIDKDVIISMIELGMKYVHDYDNTAALPLLFALA